MSATATATTLLFRRSVLNSTLLSRRQTCHRHRFAVTVVPQNGAAWMSSSSSSSRHGNGSVRLLSSTTSTTTSPATATTTPPATAAFERIALIGTGKMAHAILKPLIGKGIQPANQICIYDVSPAAMERIADEYPGVNTSQNIPDALHQADLVLLCVKPQNLTKSFFDQVQKSQLHTDKSAILLSIIAGKPISFFIEGSRGHFTKVVRSMPNTPAMIGQGMTVWSATANLCTEERTKIKRILSGFGKALYVDDETFIDMATSISGSGPAYIFMLMESMIDAGVHMGFPRDQATTLVHHTMLGSTLYAMESGEHPALLRNGVTSPSGTTASALYELENGKFRTVIKDAMWACYRRSLELGNLDSNVGPNRVQQPKPQGSNDGGFTLH